MSIPNHQNIVSELAAQYPDEWRAAHTGGPQTEAFIRRLAWVLHQRDPRFGLNGKRGNYDDISDDVVNYIGEGPGHDPRTGQPVTVIDVIVAAGGPNPQPAWNAINQPGPGGWVQPQPVDGEPVPQPTPTPTPTPSPVPIDLSPLFAVIADLGQQLDILQDDLDHIGRQVMEGRAEAERARRAIENLAERVDQGLTLTDVQATLKARFVGTVTVPVSGKVRG